MNYRPDIDGLRAVAVLPVVIFHANPSLMPGGFVGVDIFFVISGYLITLIIAGEISAGNFTLLGFYERRVRRIMPAYIAMAAFVMIGAAIFFTPEDFVLTAKASAASAAFLTYFLQSRRDILLPLLS